MAVLVAGIEQEELDEDLADAGGGFAGGFEAAGFGRGFNASLEQLAGEDAEMNVVFRQSAAVGLEGCAEDGTEGIAVVRRIGAMRGKR